MWHFEMGGECFLPRFWLILAAGVDQRLSQFSQHRLTKRCSLGKERGELLARLLLPRIAKDNQHRQRKDHV